MEKFSKSVRAVVVMLVGVHSDHHSHLNKWFSPEYLSQHTDRNWRLDVGLPKSHIGLRRLDAVFEY